MNTLAAMDSLVAREMDSYDLISALDAYEVAGREAIKVCNQRWYNRLLRSLGMDAFGMPGPDHGLVVLRREVAMRMSGSNVRDQDALRLAVLVCSTPLTFA